GPVLSPCLSKIRNCACHLRYRWVRRPKKLSSSRKPNNGCEVFVGRALGLRGAPSPAISLKDNYAKTFLREGRQPFAAPEEDRCDHRIWKPGSRTRLESA